MLLNTSLECVQAVSLIYNIKYQSRMCSSFCFIGLNVDFTGVVSTVGGGGVLRGGKKRGEKPKQNKHASGCGGG